jgi:hypothetical protein
VTPHRLGKVLVEDFTSIHPPGRSPPRSGAEKWTGLCVRAEVQTAPPGQSPGEAEDIRSSTTWMDANDVRIADIHVVEKQMLALQMR